MITQKHKELTIQKIFNLLDEYGVNGTLVTPENSNKMESHKNWPGDEDDERSSYEDNVIIINSDWIIPIGKETYKILTIDYDVEESEKYDWPKWTTSMVNINNNTWDYMDIKLLGYNHHVGDEPNEK